MSEEGETTVVHELTIPDELIRWAVERGREWVRPWGHEVDRLVKVGGERPLTPREATVLFSRLEAVCVEAVQAGEQEMLLGLDMLTAECVGLRFSFDTDAGPVTFGETLTYSELRAVVDSAPSPEGLGFAVSGKQMLADVFPQARIGAIMGLDEAPLPSCAGCGTKDAMVMMTLESGSEYCSGCYGQLIERWPSPEDLKQKDRENRAKRSRR